MRIAHWAGVHAPRGTPRAILDKMAAAVDAAMKDARHRRAAQGRGHRAHRRHARSFVKFVDEERARLGAVVKATGMKDE